jgi:hypothetical protein
MPVISTGGATPHIRYLRTLRCRVIIRHLGPRPTKLEVHANIGNFLGYTETSTHAHYVDIKTQKVKTSAHLRYDEVMCDSDDLSPNARQLRVALGHHLPAESVDAPNPMDLDLVAMSS